jgi:transcriptional regulator with XRE-family HTH domain
VERIAELRESQALTLRDLAERSGVDANTINQVELGHRKPRPSTLRKLAKALDIEVADFFREPAVPLAEAPPKSGLSDLDHSTSKLTAASALEEVAELWAEQLARGFYNRCTLGLMRFAGVSLSSTIESAARDYRETLPPHFRAQLAAAEERFADVWAQIWEAREALEEADREHPAPADELAAKREAKREEFLKQMRSAGQAKHA